MIRRLALLSTLLLMIASCVPSLHPLYTADDLVHDPALVGRFGDEDGSEVWTFERVDDHYRLSTVENGKTGLFAVHLLELEGHRYLDLFPLDMDEGYNDFYRMHRVPAHSFLYLHGVGDGLTLSVMDPKWLEEYLEAHPQAIDHAVLEDGLLLTAGTPELQAFVTQHRTQLFSDDPETLQRLPSTAD